ncbi:MAG: hypothetical protein DMG12_24750 [Acidobacteria bacterium]|nr:MAG: hypothetical protein DMG12_24750 [Acidobacteriota bacterium]
MTEGALYKSVAELNRMLRAKHVSPVELTREYIKRAERLDPQLFAVVTFTEELAMSQARAAEAEIMKGKIRGRLHGIPWGAKDLLATKGIPTQWGCPAYQEQVLAGSAARLDVHGTRCGPAVGPPPDRVPQPLPARLGSV